MKQHIERAFETAIEEHLLNHGYQKGDPATFNRSLSIDPGEVIAFIRETQPKEWSYIEQQLGPATETRIIDDLFKALNSEYEGCLKVLREGFKSYGKTFKIAYFAPANSLNPDTARLYAANRLTITRQLHYSEHNENSLDVTILINGIPVITIELKNPMTGQTYDDAIIQYKYDRDPKETIFQFKKRIFVHFAADPEEVWMTTRLLGSNTVFIPFNKGNNGGKGNPPNGDYRSSYLWEEILARDSLLDILSRFIHLQKEEKEHNGKKTITEKIIFPRYHQLQAVRMIIADAKENGAGQNYLIQHSAGSGKSNTIAWVAHRLANLYTDNDEKVFDSVVVVTDRVVLDRQLQDTIYQFDHKAGVVQKIDKNSLQLANSLTKGVPIIITTLQKFPQIANKIQSQEKRKYAVIIDEAHSSQGGEAASDMKKTLSRIYTKEEVQKRREEEELTATEAAILESALIRGKHQNLSFFAFTATPKYKTLSTFGRPGPDGKPLPFHLYSMRQAIEENFIIDVLAHYTTYNTYYKLVKSIEDDPEVERRKAAKVLARFLALHPVNIAQKTEVMVEHFRRHVMHRIEGHAKAMVVTDSRLAAVRYKIAFDKYIKDQKYPIKVLVAFSGEVNDPDVPDTSYSEQEMNGGLREKELPEKFASDDYHVLIVAEKYQTGFDQPLLHTMYVDKRMAGVQAVQTLSRLNRIHRGKEDTFVLDFINTEEEIKEAFQPFYEATFIQDIVDEQHLQELRNRLRDYKIFFDNEVEEYCRVFFKPNKKQTTSDHAQLNAMISIAKKRYEDRPENEQEEFKKVLSSYLRFYSFLSQILPYPDLDLEKLYAFGRALANAIKNKKPGELYRFDDDVALKYYRLQKVCENRQIYLEKLGGSSVDGPTDVGTGVKKGDKSLLSKIIEILNKRFGTEFTEADQLFFDSIQKDAAANEQLKQAAKANDMHNFGFALIEELDNIIVGRMENNEKIVDKFFKDSEFKDVVTPLACPSHLRGDVGFKEMGEVYELESLLKIGSEV